MKIKTEVGPGMFGSLTLNVISKGLNANKKGVYRQLGIGLHEEVVKSMFGYDLKLKDKYIFTLYRKKRLFGDRQVILQKGGRYYRLFGESNWEFCESVLNKALHTLKIRTKQEELKFYVSMKKI